MENTINASLACAFSRYQRQQVTEYLAAGGHRSGIRPAAPVRHPQLRFRMARLLLRRAAAGRPFCGGAGAGYRRCRYLSPESGAPDRAGNRLWRRHHPLACRARTTSCWKPAQGFAQWTPSRASYACRHSAIASGAAMVSYWHWHSIHNAFETYWKGCSATTRATQPAGSYHHRRRFRPPVPAAGGAEGRK